MPSKIRMANGVDVPFLGLGTGGKSVSDAVLEQAIRTALDLGYRHIDTAEMYGNEKIVGNVLQEYFADGRLTRDQVFVTTKLPCFAHEPKDVEKCLRTELEDLQLSFVDLYLVHSPCAVKNVRDPETGVTKQENIVVDIVATWRAMEEIYNKKLARSIGISNFTVEQIQRVYSVANIKPHNLQIEINLHWPQKELVTLCKALNITITAYAPLGCPGRKGQNGWPDFGPLDEPILKKLSEKYQRTPAQILLRHLTQRSIIVVPKSTNEERLRENLQSLDFFMADEDIEALNHVPPRGRVYLWKARETHPEYPFTELIDERI